MHECYFSVLCVAHECQLVFSLGFCMGNLTCKEQQAVNYHGKQGCVQIEGQIYMQQHWIAVLSTVLIVWWIVQSHLHLYCTRTPPTYLDPIFNQLLTLEQRSQRYAQHKPERLFNRGRRPHPQWGRVVLWVGEDTQLSFYQHLYGFKGALFSYICFQVIKNPKLIQHNHKTPSFTQGCVCG